MIDEIIAFAQKNNVEKVILFGSRARGDFKERSDIDLAFQGGNSSSFILDVDEDTTTLLEFDIIDLDKPIQQELLESIRQEGVLIYEKICHVSQTGAGNRYGQALITEKTGMEENDINAQNWNKALYKKMAAEQDIFREWLKGLPYEEILRYAYEYAVREDIVMAMEELELTDAQAKALLKSPTPLADVYRYFEKLETGYMDILRAGIENRANDARKIYEET